MACAAPNPRIGTKATEAGVGVGRLPELKDGSNASSATHARTPAHILGCSIPWMSRRGATVGVEGTSAVLGNGAQNACYYFTTAEEHLSL